MTLGATKTGMLASAALVEVVAEAARRFSLGPLVVDPVMVAKSGDPLVDASPQQAYVELLCPSPPCSPPTFTRRRLSWGGSFATWTTCTPLPATSGRWGRGRSW